jgi:hypothetical protein
MDLGALLVLAVGPRSSSPRSLRCSASLGNVKSGQSDLLSLKEDSVILSVVLRILLRFPLEVKCL